MSRLNANQQPQMATIAAANHNVPDVVPKVQQLAHSGNEDGQQQQQYGHSQ